MTLAGMVGEQPTLGAVVRLPADEEIGVTASAGLSFVVLDLAGGPNDEVLVRRLAVAAKASGLAVLALASAGVDTSRLGELGVDAMVTTHEGHHHVEGVGEIALVTSREEARRAGGRGVKLVALDLPRAIAGLLASFAATSDAAIDRDEVMMLPGMLGDPRVFDGIVSVLVPGVNCRPVRIDLDDSVEEMAESTLCAAPARFALVGHSLGGIVALEIVRRAPDRVTRIALLNASARPPSEAQLEAWAVLRERTDAGLFATIVQEQASVNLGGHARPDLVAAFVEMAESVGPDGFQRQLRAQAGRPDSRPSLAGIDVPTLVLSGTADSVCPIGLQREMAAAVPRATHAVVEGAGHMSLLDHPGEVATHLVTWLGG